MKKKKRASLIKAEEALQETLRISGYTGTKSKHFKNEIPDYKVKSNVVSSESVCDSGIKKKTQTYTGDELLGIALMHKSNYVPVRKDSKQDAIEISKMRR